MIFPAVTFFFFLFLFLFLFFLIEEVFLEELLVLLEGWCLTIFSDSFFSENCSCSIFSSWTFDSLLENWGGISWFWISSETTPSKFLRNESPSSERFSFSTKGSSSFSSAAGKSKTGSLKGSRSTFLGSIFRSGSSESLLLGRSKSSGSGNLVSACFAAFSSSWRSIFSLKLPRENSVVSLSTKFFLLMISFRSIIKFYFS